MLSTPLVNNRYSKAHKNEADKKQNGSLLNEFHKAYQKYADTLKTSDDPVLLDKLVKEHNDLYDKLSAEEKKGQRKLTGGFVKGQKQREGKKQNDKRNDWFAMIDKIMYMWDRMDGQTLRGHVDVDRYFELDAAVRKMGGAIMDKKFDKIAGKDWVKIREPKELQKNESDIDAKYREMISLYQSGDKSKAAKAKQIAKEIMDAGGHPKESKQKDVLHVIKSNSVERKNAKSKNDPEYKKFYKDVDKKVTWASELDMSNQEFDDEVLDSYMKGLSVDATVKIFKSLRGDSKDETDRFMRGPHD